MTPDQDFHNFVAFQISTKINTIVKTSLWILEHETDISPDQFLIKRKQLLDLGGNSIRDLEKSLNKLNITLK